MSSCDAMHWFAYVYSKYLPSLNVSLRTTLPFNSPAHMNTKRDTCDSIFPRNALSSTIFGFKWPRFASDPNVSASSTATWYCWTALDVIDAHSTNPHSIFANLMIAIDLSNLLQRGVVFLIVTITTNTPWIGWKLILRWYYFYPLANSMGEFKISIRLHKTKIAGIIEWNLRSRRQKKTNNYRNLTRSRLL